MEPDEGAAARSGSLPGDVLIVEDDPLIALDLEETLRQFGIGSVRTAASVAAALQAIGHRKPEFALLNVGLGRETTFAVADRLETLAVPYVFLTGYGARTEYASQFAHRPRLNKPYVLDALEKALRNYGSS